MRHFAYAIFLSSQAKSYATNRFLKVTYSSTLKVLQQLKTSKFRKSQNSTISNKSPAVTQLKDGDDGLSYKYWRAWYGSKFKAEPDDGDIIASPRYFQRGDHDKVILVPKDIDDYLVKAAFWLGHVQGIRANPINV